MSIIFRNVHAVYEADFLPTDLLTHTPSPEPQRYQKKGGEVNNNVDIVDGNKTRERKGNES